MIASIDSAALDIATDKKFVILQEQGCWSITTYFTSKILSSKNIKHQQQVNN